MRPWKCGYGVGNKDDSALLTYWLTWDWDREIIFTRQRSRHQKSQCHEYGGHDRSRETPPWFAQFRGNALADQHYGSASGAGATWTMADLVERTDVT